MSLTHSRSLVRFQAETVFFPFLYVCYNHYIYCSAKVINYKCDPLSENLTCLHNSVLELNAIEIYLVKKMCAP